MKQSQQLRLGQSLTMTPALQQSIRLLQLSTLDLQTEIEQALEQNLMLERIDDAPVTSTENPGEEAETPTPDTDADLDEPAESEAEEWLQAESSGSGSHDSDEDDLRQSGLHVPPSLHDHLIWQANTHPFNDLERALAHHLVDAVDDNGYLTEWDALRERLLAQPGVTPDLLASVLARVQEFDPVGVAARDIRECLLLQLRPYDPATPGLDEARRLITHSQGLTWLAEQQSASRLAQALDCTTETLQQALVLIRSLAPHPGAAYARHETEYVTPEIFVSKRRGRWQAQLNPEIAPRLRINAEYSALVRRADSSPQQQTLKQHLQEARFFLNSLKSRNDTLLRVAQCIVETQRGFLDYGAEAMRPLILRDVAERLGVHESTVSRATAHKYMATPRGLFELKYFFSSQVATTTGGAASATAIQAIIRRLVQSEPANEPHSDQKLSELLLGEGIKVARRTVAKYRELMDIAPSHERKPPA